LIKPVQVKNITTAPSELGRSQNTEKISETKPVLATDEISKPVLKISSKPTHKIIGIKEYLLENGLRLVLIPNEDKLVSGNLIIKSGSLEDPEGQKGVAHFVEHLVSSAATKNFEEKEFSSFTLCTDGNDNAATDHTSTEYEWELQPDFLELGLERFQAILNRQNNFSQERVDSEKQIILNEASTSREVQEASTLSANSLFWGDAKDPRISPIIGIEKDISAMTASSINDFANTHNRPDNSVLILSGNFNEKELLNKVRETIGKIPNPETALSKNELKVFKAQKKHKSETILSQVEEGLELRYKIPGELNGDLHSLEVLSFVIQGRIQDPNKNPFYNSIKEVEASVQDYGYSGECSLKLTFIENGERVDKQKVEKFIIGIINDIKRNGISEDELSLQNIVTDEYLRDIREQTYAKHSFVTSVESGVRPWYKALEDLQSRIMDPDKIKKTAEEFFKSKNCTSIYTIKSPNREMIRTQVTSEQDKNITINNKDIQISIPKALKGRVDINEITSDFKPKIIKTDDFNLVHIYCPKERIILNFRKAGGERVQEEQKNCLPLLTTTFLNKLVGYESNNKIPLEDNLLKIRSAINFDFTQDSHGFTLSFPEKEKGQIAKVLKLITNQKIFDYHKNNKDLETILTQAKDEVLGIYQSIYADPNAYADIALRNSIAKNMPEILDLNPQEVSNELAQISIEDIKRFFLHNYGLKKGSLAITGPINTGEVDSLRHQISDWLNKFPTQNELARKDIEAQSSAQESSHYLQNRDVQTTTMGKTWNLSVDDYQADKIINITNFLTKQKLMKAIRENLSQIYDIDLELDLIDHSNLGITKITFEASKEKQGLIKDLIKQVVNLISEHGFSEEEISIAKLHMLYREKNLRVDITDYPMRYLRDVQADFKDYKKSLAKLEASTVNNFARSALKADEMSLVTVA
jgi:predicted Zn-dependent peptidase